MTAGCRFGFSKHTPRAVIFRDLIWHTPQVERLSSLTQRASELGLEQPLRLDVINSAVNVQTRTLKFFEAVEADLYGKLTGSSAQIAVPSSCMRTCVGASSTGVG